MPVSIWHAPAVVMLNVLQETPSFLFLCFLKIRRIIWLKIKRVNKRRNASVFGDYSEQDGLRVNKFTRNSSRFRRFLPNYFGSS
jgi:hypothetical protein